MRRPGQEQTLAQEQSASVVSAFGSPPYCLPKDPLLMYISAVSRPNNVLEVQVTREKPRSQILAFRGDNNAGIPGAL